MKHHNTDHKRERKQQESLQDVQSRHRQEMAVILQEEERKERNRQRMLQNAPEQAGMREKLVQQHENERRRATEFLKQTM